MEEHTSDSSIAKTIDDFHHQMQSLSSLVTAQLKHATENQEREIEAIKTRRQLASDTLAGATQSKIRSIELAEAINTIYDCSRACENLETVSQNAMLAELMFVSAFSKFDAFLNHLLHKLLTRPKLVAAIEKKKVPFGEVRKSDSGQILRKLISHELNSLLRKSYSQIFDALALRFNIHTLKKFESWKTFIEASQRRNLIVHCDGIVSEQYLKVCRSENVSMEESVKLGSKLSITQDYLLNAINTVTEVGIKLGHVLWRASDDSSTATADSHLGNLMFMLLKREAWGLALELGAFGLQIPVGKRLIRSERSLKIITINYAQAAKWSGNNKLAHEIINGFDWSGSAHDFRLAIECLMENWDKAADIMKKIGRDADAIPIHGYSGWPIFREFRKTSHFLDAFHAVFGSEFAISIVGDSDIAKEQVAGNNKEDVATSSSDKDEGEPLMPVDPTTK